MPQWERAERNPKLRCSLEVHGKLLVFPEQPRLLPSSEPKLQTRQPPLGDGTGNPTREGSSLCSGLRGFQCRDFRLIFCSLFISLNSAEVTRVRRGMRMPLPICVMENNLMFTETPRVSSPPSKVSPFSHPCSSPPKLLRPMFFFLARFLNYYIHHCRLSCLL